MGQELKMRKVQDQISGILQIANQFIPSEQRSMFQSKIQEQYPEFQLWIHKCESTWSNLMKGASPCLHLVQKRELYLIYFS